MSNQNYEQMKFPKFFGAKAPTSTDNQEQQPKELHTALIIFIVAPLITSIVLAIIYVVWQLLLHHGLIICVMSFSYAGLRLIYPLVSRSLKSRSLARASEKSFDRRYRYWEKYGRHSKYPDTLPKN